VLDVKLDGVRLRDWPYGELKRRHAVALVDVMLREQGRAAAGAQNILRTLSAMTEDAITDEVADANPFKGVKVRANDPRVQKAPIAVRVFSWADMHRLCAAAALPKLRAGKEPAELSDLDRWRAVYAEPMLRVLADCGLRLGELMPLERRDLDGQVLHIRRTAHEGRVLQGTKTDHGHADGGRVVPVPPALAQLLLEMPKRIDSPLLFPTVRGRLWRERNWYRDVWDPARERTGLDTRPHELRHSWVSHLSAAGVDEASLADMAGHTVATMTGRYRHAVQDDFDAARAAVGA
jgi:integrase